MIRQGSQRRNCPDYFCGRIGCETASIRPSGGTQRNKPVTAVPRHDNLGPAHRCTVDFTRARSTGYASTELVVSVIPARAGFGGVSGSEIARGTYTPATLSIYRA